MKQIYIGIILFIIITFIFIVIGTLLTLNEFHSSNSRVGIHCYPKGHSDSGTPMIVVADNATLQMDGNLTCDKN